MKSTDPRTAATRRPAAEPDRHSATQHSEAPNAFDGSPRMLAQRRAIDAAFGPVAQRWGAEPDDEAPREAMSPAAGPVNETGMPAALKSGLEALSGMDLSDVRVHRNSAQPAQLNAHAFAQGNDIHLAAGQEHHLPHEAWHVVQQAQGRVSETMQMGGVAVNDDAGLEREADVMGARATTTPPAAQPLQRRSTSARRVQRRVVQRLAYAELSPPQRAQVDAISENTYYRKMPAYQQRVQVVANADARGAASADATLNALAPRVPVPEQPGVLAQLAQTLAVKLQFLASGQVPGLVPSPFVTGSATETLAQTTDFRPMVGGLVNPQFEQPVPGGQLQLPTMEGNRVRPDSRYARESRDARQVVGRTGVAAIPAIRHLATMLNLAAPVVANLKVAFLDVYLAAGHSLQEVLKSADGALAAVDGEHIAEHLAPLTEASIALLPPGYFLQHRFKSLLTQAMHPVNAAERVAALGLMPVDVSGWVQDIVNNVPPVRSEADLATLIGLNVPRVLIETATPAQLTAITTFMQGALTDAAVALLQAAVGDRNAALLAGIRCSTAGVGAAEHQRWGRVGETLRENFTVPVEDGHGFADAETTRVRDHVVNANRLKYGAQDAGVALQPVDFAGITAAPNVTRALAIHDYTRTDFQRYSTLYQVPHAPSSRTTGALDDQARREMTVRARALASGLQMLPVFTGPVYVGLPSQTLATPAARDAAAARYRAGTFYSPASPFSASKTVELSSWIQPEANPHVAFVIDGSRTGRDIQLISSQPGEREVLFPASSRFVVVRTQDALTSAGDPNAFVGGTFWVYLREVVTTDTPADALALAQSRAPQHRKEVAGHRFVDAAHYEAAETAYGREVPLNRAAAGLTDGVNAFTAPQHAYGVQQFADWEAAAGLVENQVVSGQDLSVANIQAIHQQAGGALLGAQAGQLRGIQVVAGGGLGPEGCWIELTPAKLQVVQQNPVLTFTGASDAQLLQMIAAGQAARDADPNEFVRRTTDAQLQDFRARVAAGNHVGLLAYPHPGAINHLLTAFVAEFLVRKQAVPPNVGPTAHLRVPAIHALAAWTQRTFVSIHPFRDGNGRTSRLLMDYVHRSFGMDPALLVDTNADMFSTQDEWAQTVAAGSARTADFRRHHGAA